MNGDYARRGTLCEMQVGGRQAGLPVVAMHQVGTPSERRFVAAQHGGDFGEQAEAQRIVRPINAVDVLVGAAVSLVQDRAIEHQQRHIVRHLAGQQTCRRKARQGVEGGDDLVLRQLCDDLLVSRHQDAHVHADGVQTRRAARR